MKAKDEQKDWILDRRIPIFTLFGLVFQLVAVVWFFAQLSSDVESNTNMITRVEISAENRMVRHEKDSANRTELILHALERIEDKLDAKMDR